MNTITRRWLSRLFAIALPLTISLPAAESRGQRAATPLDLVFVQAPVVQSGNPSTRFPQGSHLVRLNSKSQSPLTLTSDLYASADPQVSFDGSRILFAAKEKVSTPWQVWEMSSDGSDKRQVTRCADDCLRPAYLPRDEIVFTALTKEGSGPAWQLFVSKRDGSEAHAITFGPGDFQVETVLHNGMILASARSPLLPVDAANADNQTRELYTLRPDGSGLASLRCDHKQPAARSEAAELDDGSMVFVKRLLSGPQASNQLAIIPRGALHNSAIATSPTVPYSLKPLGGERLIVAAWRTAGGVPKAGSAMAKLDLYAYDAAQQKFAGLIYQDTKLSSLAAVPVAAHEAPRWYWSTLNPELKEGYFVCLDSSRTDLPASTGDARGGRFPVAPAKVRVLMLDSATQQERSLGEAPVEKDGSFYIAVPPDRPVRFELLDESNRVLRAQRSWTWSRPGEERGCVGCHEDRALAPENRWPMALHRLDTPFGLGVKGGSPASHE